MFRIKYRHPFCGNSWIPLILIVAFIIGLALPFPEPYPNSYPLLNGAAAAFVVGCVISVIMHIPNTGDIDCMRQSAEPVWEKLPESLRERIRKTEQDNRLSFPVLALAVAILCGIPFLITLLPGTETNEQYLTPDIAMYISLGIGVVSVAAILVYQIRSRIWEGIDDSAVYSTIPVHHFFQDERSHNGHKYTVTFLVFYTPHGKYILESDNGTAAEYVLIIKYRSMLRWFVMPEKAPKKPQPDAK